MDEAGLKHTWQQEEDIAHIHGWDFSHIHGRYREEAGLPWDYEQLIRQHLQPRMKLLDCDTGGGEFLLSLHHPYENTAATEGYPPNVALCRQRLTPLGIDLRSCDDAAHIPFPDASFDLIINRHGDYDPGEIMRLLRPGGLFITQQVGAENDRDLVKLVLPGMSIPFPEARLAVAQRALQEAGLDILYGNEAFRPIVFTDVGAFVWFARIISWEFPGFSVDACFPQLLKLQEMMEEQGRIQGTIHRYVVVARKTDQ